MGYLGYKPADKPLTSADITDSIITSAKITDGTIALADLSATGTKDATTFLRGDNTFATAGGNNTPAFSATGTTQSISTGTNTKIQFNSEIFDTDNCYDPTTNYRFTPTTAGKYLLLLNVRCRRTTDFNDLNISIRKNGSSVDRFQNNSSFHNESRLLLTILTANGSTDYFEAFIEQNSGETDTMDIFEFSGFRLIGV